MILTSHISQVRLVLDVLLLNVLIHGGDWWRSPVWRSRV